MVMMIADGDANNRSQHDYLLTEKCEFKYIEWKIDATLNQHGACDIIELLVN